MIKAIASIIFIAITSTGRKCYFQVDLVARSMSRGNCIVNTIRDIVVIQVVIIRIGVEAVDIRRGNR